MTLPHGSMPFRKTVLETRASYGEFAEHSPEAAAAIERVRLASNGGVPKPEFSINGTKSQDRVWKILCPEHGVLNANSAKQRLCPLCRRKTNGAYQVSKDRA